MKIPRTYLLLILFICCSAFSQEQTGVNFSSDNERLNVITNIEYDRLNFAHSVANQQNSIFIQQIGDNNKVYSQTQSQNSRINLYQNGNSNNVDINANAPSINAFVIQNGNNNYIQDNVYYSNVQVKLNAIQNGDNLTINRLGVNSLSNKLQLVQEGSFKTITVISN